MEHNYINTLEYFVLLFMSLMYTTIAFIIIEYFPNTHLYILFL